MLLHNYNFATVINCKYLICRISDIDPRERLLDSQRESTHKLGTTALDQGIHGDHTLMANRSLGGTFKVGNRHVHNRLQEEGLLSSLMSNPVAVSPSRIPLRNLGLQSLLLEAAS